MNTLYYLIFFDDWKWNLYNQNGWTLEKIESLVLDMKYQHPSWKFRILKYELE